MSSKDTIRSLCKEYGYEVVWRGQSPCSYDCAGDGLPPEIADIWFKRGADYPHTIYISRLIRDINRIARRYRYDLRSQFERHFHFDTAKYGRRFEFNDNLKDLFKEYGYTSCCTYKTDAKYACVIIHRPDVSSDKLIYTHNYGIALPLREQFEIIKMLCSDGISKKKHGNCDLRRTG